MASLDLVQSKGSISLRSVTAHCHILDVLASVQLSQVFTNTTSAETDSDAEAIYRFPVPPGAAVCGFEAVLDDGSKIIGRIQEKADAKKKYDEAVKSGKQAALATFERADSRSTGLLAIDYVLIHHV